MNSIVSCCVNPRENSAIERGNCVGHLSALIYRPRRMVAGKTNGAIFPTVITSSRNYFAIKQRFINKFVTWANKILFFFFHIFSFFRTSVPLCPRFLDIVYLSFQYVGKKLNLQKELGSPRIFVEFFSSPSACGIRRGRMRWPRCRVGIDHERNRDENWTLRATPTLDSHVRVRSRHFTKTFNPPSQCVHYYSSIIYSLNEIFKNFTNLRFIEKSVLFFVFTAVFRCADHIRPSFLRRRTCKSTTSLITNVLERVSERESSNNQNSKFSLRTPLMNFAIFIFFKLALNFFSRFFSFSLFFFILTTIRSCKNLLAAPFPIKSASFFFFVFIFYLYFSLNFFSFPSFFLFSFESMLRRLLFTLPRVNMKS